MGISWWPLSCSIECGARGCSSFFSPNIRHIINERANLENIKLYIVDYGPSGVLAIHVDR